MKKQITRPMVKLRDGSPFRSPQLLRYLATLSLFIKITEDEEFRSRLEADLWQLLSGDYALTARMAGKIYAYLGYEPFSGFPLTRIH
jgi:hypothetical protein